MSGLVPSIDTGIAGPGKGGKVFNSPTQLFYRAGNEQVYKSPTQQVATNVFHYCPDLTRTSRLSGFNENNLICLTGQFKAMLTPHSAHKTTWSSLVDIEDIIS